MTIGDFLQRAQYNGGFDRVIGKWRIIDVHQIPEQLTPQHEIDFYCCNGEVVYLLRLRNRPAKKFEIIQDKTANGFPPYLVAELPITQVSNDLIINVLNEFFS